MSFASSRWPAMMAGHRKSLYGLAAWLAILLIGGVLGASSQLSGRAEPVAAYVVDRGDIEKTVLATGILKPSVQVNVGAQVNGQLKKLYVRAGDRVTRGQLLAEIDPTLQQSELRKSEAALESAVAQKQASQFTLTQYQLELKRQLRMDRDGSGTKSTRGSAGQGRYPEGAGESQYGANCAGADGAGNGESQSWLYADHRAGGRAGIGHRHQRGTNRGLFTDSADHSGSGECRYHDGANPYFRNGYFESPSRPAAVVLRRRRTQTPLSERDGGLQDAPNDALQDDSARPQGNRPLPFIITVCSACRTPIIG